LGKFEGDGCADQARAGDDSVVAAHGAILAQSAGIRRGAESSGLEAAS
jgi:hypothetical protein